MEINKIIHEYGSNIKVYENKQIEIFRLNSMIGFLSEENYFQEIKKNFKLFEEEKKNQIKKNFFYYALNDIIINVLIAYIFL